LKAPWLGSGLEFESSKQQAADSSKPKPSNISNKNQEPRRAAGGLLAARVTSRQRPEDSQQPGQRQRTEDRRPQDRGPRQKQEQVVYWDLGFVGCDCLWLCKGCFVFALWAIYLARIQHAQCGTHLATPPCWLLITSHPPTRVPVPMTALNSNLQYQSYAS
jgi:hypothetical protein